MDGWARALVEGWYGGAPPALGLRLVATVYGAAMRLRRSLYRVGLLRQHRLDVPVLVVGNRTVGGAGKTPLVIALVAALRARGWRPGVVTRGYGRRSRGPVMVGPDSDPADCGDEPLLIHRQTGAPVDVDVDRVAAAHRLVDAGCDLVIADDGLQHLRLGRRLEIEVEDARGQGNGFVMPAGPLREPRPAARAAFRVVHGREPRGDEVAMRLQIGVARRLVSPDAAAADETRPLSDFAGSAVHAVAGIGHPARFFSALRAAGLSPIEHPFPDHHAFSAADFADWPAHPILMTSKDAVKCGRLGLVDAWEVPVDPHLPAAFFDTLDHQLREPPSHVDP